MNWAKKHIEKLSNGETVQFRPRGNSMSGIVNNGDLVTVEPLDNVLSLKKGDVVLCKVHGNVYLHLVKAISKGRVLIGNNFGKINGWTKNVYGKCVKVEK